MPHKGPHISIAADYVVNRILRVNLNEFEEWPESVRRLAVELAEELFLVVYNPFVDAEMVRKSVAERFAREQTALAQHYATSLGEGITMFWSAHEADMAFKAEVEKALAPILVKGNIERRPGALVENSTDATDLRMELPMMVVLPGSAEEVSAIVRLANTMKFAIIPRGGGSGMTGGAVPARKRTVIMNMGRLVNITNIDVEKRVLSAEAGVITQDAIDAVAAKGLLFTVDPASKYASTIGGNIAENSGGPYGFEYGTTIDCLLSWRMVTPTGEIIDVERLNHPGHKILPDETVEFAVKDLSGGVRNVVRLTGAEIRQPGLGKDVTNKALGGLPGMQKEGVDGIIISANFLLYPQPKHSRVLAMEFYGRSMQNASLVVRDIVALRDAIRREGDHVTISAFEEFNSKYVRAIEYKKKSEQYEGDPISVFIMQMDSDDTDLLDSAVRQVVDIATPYDGVDVMVAEDEEQAELFWEDRHKLSAIARRTSGFKINEDIVIPIEAVPDFANFLERLNLESTAHAYRNALQAVGRLAGMPLDDKEFNREFTFASKVSKGEIKADELSDEELLLRAVVFLRETGARHPTLDERIERIKDHMLATRIEVASHMHAGDGNCHVNIPVNSNDPEMLHAAEEAAQRVMRTAQEMNGAVSGEHGIGITKIAFLPQDKMDALREFKHRVDPRDVLNPAKLTQRELPVRPFTFSFNRLLTDIRDSGLPDKERLIALLTNIQICTRCGKCKQVCPMFLPQQSMEYHPRNKNMALGALVEALYYAQINTGKPDPVLLGHLRHLIEHCTGCGKCTAVCPVKINSSEVALSLRALLEDENAGGHPIKKRVLGWIAKAPENRVPMVAKAAAVGQRLMNRTMGLVPAVWRERFASPLFSGPGPAMGYKNLTETLPLGQGNIFLPPAEPDKENSGPRDAVFYFPGCGGGLFYRTIGLAGIAMLLRAGVAVILPPAHLCCGYPLLSSGADRAYAKNREHNLKAMDAAIKSATDAGLRVTHILTACGTCRDSLQRYELAVLNRDGQPPLVHQDVVQFLLTRLSEPPQFANLPEVIYHPSCHAEWVGAHKVKAANIYAKSLAEFTGVPVQQNSGCCGESGMGAVTSPAIYNKLRARKKNKLAAVLPKYGPDRPIIVGCPSCKIGIARTMISLHGKNPVLHTLEWLAEGYYGLNWQETVRKTLLKNRAAANVSPRARDAA